MELRALRYFVVVAEELHFGRAADRLHIAQPAVSRQIARLERELGTRLLERSPRAVRLTAAGRRVLDAAREALRAADQVRAVAESPVGVMRIGVAAGIGARLERGIDQLREQVPGSDVVLLDLPLAARLNAVRDGEVDVALVRGMTSAPGLRVVPAWTEALLAIVSAKHPVAQQESVGPDDLAPADLRIPFQDYDLEIHEKPAALAWGPRAMHSRCGRPTGTARSTVVEVGSHARSWMVLPADHAQEIGSTRVRALPFEPQQHVVGSVVIPTDLPHRCASAYQQAFGD
ncbi:LysR family transcriptional regulator [Promicromonospora sp. NPDC060204]|uniref:LysR family transcriptional regulator n=1 Tax=Promicromonospora sp. NPDC060204 TaxID=3347071 RepID=UPI0036674556